MRLIGWILLAGAALLFVTWWSDAAGCASLFVAATGFVFLEAGRAKPAPFDDLGRGRLP